MSAVELSQSIYPLSIPLMCHEEPIPANLKRGRVTPVYCRANKEKNNPVHSHLTSHVKQKLTYYTYEDFKIYIFKILLICNALFLYLLSETICIVLRQNVLLNSQILFSYPNSVTVKLKPLLLCVLLITLF